MQPKYIIVKIYSKVFFSLFVNELKNYDKIHFVSKKINGINTVIIKCQNYYKKFIDSSFDNIYLSYIYLYTNVSLILSELIIKCYELKITYQILSSKYSHLAPYDIEKLKNIIHIILDSNYPSIESKKLYLYRKDLILNKLLLNFRNKNYIYADHFAFFKLKNYYEYLEDVIEKTYSHYWLFIPVIR